MNFGTCIARRISSSKPFRSWPKGAKNGRLKALFTDHLEETKDQVLRLKQVFEILEEKPTGEHCNGMEGVIEEGADALEKDEEGASFDSGIVGAALRTEHYEIAGYTAAIAMADTLGLKDVSGLLSKNLHEEKLAVDKILAAAKRQSFRNPRTSQKKKTESLNRRKKIFGPEEPGR